MFPVGLIDSWAARLVDWATCACESLAGSRGVVEELVDVLHQLNTSINSNDQSRPSGSKRSLNSGWARHIRRSSRGKSAPVRAAQA